MKRKPTTESRPARQSTVRQAAISVRLSAEERSKIEEAARLEDRTASYFLRRAGVKDAEERLAAVRNVK